MLSFNLTMMKDSLSIAMEEFLQMLTEPFYFVNDEGMREGTTHQVIHVAKMLSLQFNQGDNDQRSQG